MVYFCYIDESGTPQIPGNTSHYVLCGVSIPVKYWKRCDKQIAGIKAKYGLANAEIHTGWIKRTYLEQTKIQDFDKLSYADRRTFICNALSMGIPTDIVMKWTGHSDYSAMKPYIDIAQAEKSKAMAKFNKKK